MVSVVINYCSNEKIFIDALLIQCLKFSDDIVVSYGSHLYDGSPEDINHINEYIKKYNTVKFVEYNVDINLDLMKQKGVNKRPIAYLHNLARWIGICSLKDKGKGTWVYIIDCDEIPEGDNVKKWLSETILDKKYCYKMANYWYFKSPQNQALTIEDSVLLIHSDYLTSDNIFGDMERDYLIPASKCILKRQIMGLNNKPLFHHFSWYRSKKGLKHKISSWGHKNDIFKDIDTDLLIDYIYKDDNVNDIIHRYEYNKVDNIFNI